MRISILGATSHIAKGLVVRYLARGGNDICLYVRSAEKMRDFLRGEGLGLFDAVYGFDSFGERDCDLIINCVGLGTPEKVVSAKGGIFAITEQFDGLVLSYLDRHPDTVCVNFSSGAVYGSSFSRSVDAGSNTEIAVNDIRPSDYYRIAKLNSEAKHRAFNGNIIDLRVFSYFSRYIDMSSRYLMTEIIRSVRDNVPFVTGSDEIVRDYVHPDDLFDLVNLAAAAKGTNAAYDVYSAAEVRKSGIIEYFSSHYGLQVSYVGAEAGSSATGSKNIYCSQNRAASVLGYEPKFTSIDAIAAEAAFLLEGCRK